MTIASLRAITTEAKLLLIGIPVFLWTIIPIYSPVLFAISPKESAFAGNLWPDHPTLRNFEVVFGQKHYFLAHFWLQLWNSLVVAVATGAITLFVATAAAFASARLKVKGGRLIMNLALFTYFIPAAFLAVPMYRTMGTLPAEQPMGADPRHGDDRGAVFDLGAEAGVRQAALRSSTRRR